MFLFVAKQVLCKMKITVAESRILDVLWRADRPLAVEEVAETLAAREEGWTEGTVRTLMTRLKKKRGVAATKEGRRLFYRPLADRKAFLEAESTGLVDRLFDGRLGSFVSHFTENRDLSKDEIAELQALIDRLGHGR